MAVEAGPSGVLDPGGAAMAAARQKLCGQKSPRIPSDCDLSDITSTRRAETTRSQ
jgi:hypothetical protein